MSKEDKELLEQRILMYRFLSSVFMDELDENLLKALMEADLPEHISDEPWSDNISEGFKLVKQSLEGAKGGSDEEIKSFLEDLAADYAKTFLAAGDAAGKAAFPYEAIYAGTDSPHGGSIEMQLDAKYAASGLKMREDMFKVSCDHISLELEYMARMLEEGSEEANKEAKEFFDEHIINWAGLFANDIYKYSERDYYKGIARILLGFIEAEKEVFNEL